MGRDQQGEHQRAEQAGPALLEAEQREFVNVAAPAARDRPALERQPDALEAGVERGAAQKPPPLRPRGRDRRPVRQRGRQGAGPESGRQDTARGAGERSDRQPAVDAMDPEYHSAVRLDNQRLDEAGKAGLAGRIGAAGAAAAAGGLARKLQQ